MDLQRQDDFKVDIKPVPPADRGGLTTDIRVALPARVGTDVLSIPAGKELDIDIELQEADQGILAHFTCETTAFGHCCRCLQDVMFPLTIERTTLFFYPEERQALIAEGDEEAESYPIIVEGDNVDLETEFIDAAIPLMPYQPLCDADCPGLCQECGEMLIHLPPDHHHDTIDPRFRALEGFFQKDEQ